MYRTVMSNAQSVTPRERVIRALMSQAGMSEAALAPAVGMSRTTLRSKLAGDRFTVPELDRLAAVFGTTASAILAEAEASAA